MKTFLERRFYFAMAVLTAAVVVIGFAPKFDARMLHPSHPAPISLWVHTVVFSGWVILLLVQTGLVQAGKASLHRTLGMASSILGVVLPIVGAWVAIDTGHEKVLQGKTGGESFLLVPLSDMVFFAALFGLGLWWRKRPELHRRLMLLASVSLTVAAFARFPKYIVPGGHFNIACDLMILLAVGRDLVVDRRVQFEPHTPTKAWKVPTMLWTLGQLLGYERLSERSKACLRQTEPPNALLASWRCPG